MNSMDLFRSSKLDQMKILYMSFEMLELYVYSCSVNCGLRVYMFYYVTYTKTLPNSSHTCTRVVLVQYLKCKQYMS